MSSKREVGGMTRLINKWMDDGNAAVSEDENERVLGEVASYGCCVKVNF